MNRYHKQRRQKRRRRFAFGIGSLCVAFGVTVSLMLPAVTQEQEVFCGYLEHTHTTECTAVAPISPELTCTLEEGPGHQHTEECFDAEGNLICLTDLTEEHYHNESCYASSTETALLDDSNESTLIYSLDEHVHSLQCFSNPAADVETPEIWERTLPGEFSGIWAEDLLNVAYSQLGYCESTNNYLVQPDGSVNGYTRFGARYDAPYDNWSALFVSFCLDAAQIPGEAFPKYSSCQEWLDALRYIDTAFYQQPGTYTPAPGDLVFFNTGATGAADVANHMGIITQITEEEVSGFEITTIEGDRNGSVAICSYSLTDASIVGFASLPAVPLLEEGESSEPTEEIAFAEITEPTEYMELAESAETNASETFTLFCEGEDYRIEVSFSQEALLPADVILTAVEILPGTEEYDAYYAETLASFPSDSYPEFCRFFDITFLSDGIKVEPAAPVCVNIYYNEPLPDVTGDGQVIHFADNGTEIIDADLEATEEGGSSFAFTQNSFSVVGTVVTAAAANDISYLIQVDAISDTSANYVILCEENGTQYALGAVRSGMSYKATSVVVTTTPYSGLNGVYTSGEISSGYLWQFSSAISGSGTCTVKNKSYSKYLNLNSTNLIGNSYNCTLTCNSEGYWSISNGSRYLDFSNGSFTRSSSSVDPKFRIYKYTQSLPEYNIWLDGTNGNNVMQLKGSDDTMVTVTSENGYAYTLPETWKSPGKYAYSLKGWYDIYAGVYYAPGETVTVTEDTVFYADWVASTYDVGQNNSHVVSNLDTSRFITTNVFDYGVLFNVMSANASGTVSSDSHSETWSLVTNGPVHYKNQNTIGITFRDWDYGGKSITYVNGYDRLLSGGLSINNNHGKEITTDILATSNGLSGGNLINTFFDPGNSFDVGSKTGVIGKTYLGTGNYLYQYMDSTTESYDGSHNGYYYFDSRLNAASYNQSEQRFYVYDYLERTSDSLKDGGAGAYSDFLPFNSPYANTNGKTVNTYSADTHSGTNYQYDAKYSSTEGGVACTADQAGTNYGFGISSDIKFFLPAASGVKDEAGEYINQSISGQDLTFEFSGDDDVWVFVDGSLIMDIGGLHGIIQGSINFSTGEVITNGNSKFYSFGAGEHSLSVYYLERGGSQSNCAIYFNIAPRYSMDITKIDIETQEHLAGAEFTIYVDESCTLPAENLWTSQAAHDNFENTQSTFTCNSNGVASCWGLIPGNVYYVKETKSPDELKYTDTGGIVKVSLNASGNATYEAVKVSGSEGFTVQGFTVDATRKELQMGITNAAAKETDQIQLNVEKCWSDGNEKHNGDVITIHLLRDEEKIDSVQLSSANNWTHSFENLPLAEETNPEHTYVYTVSEDPVESYLPNYGNAVFNDGVYTIVVTNSPVYILPETGGVGTYLYTALGIVFILGSFVILFARKPKGKYL